MVPPEAQKVNIFLLKILSVYSSQSRVQQTVTTSLYTAEWAQPGCGDFSLTWPHVETPRNKLLDMSVRSFIDWASWARKTQWLWAVPFIDWCSRLHIKGKMNLINTVICLSLVVGYGCNVTLHDGLYPQAANRDQPFYPKVALARCLLFGFGCCFVFPSQQ